MKLARCSRSWRPAVAARRSTRRRCPAQADPGRATTRLCVTKGAVDKRRGHRADRARIRARQRRRRRPADVHVSRPERGRARARVGAAAAPGRAQAARAGQLQRRLRDVAARSQAQARGLGEVEPGQAYARRVRRRAATPRSSRAANVVPSSRTARRTRCAPKFRRRAGRVDRRRARLAGHAARARRATSAAPPGCAPTTCSSTSSSSRRRVVPLTRAPARSARRQKKADARLSGRGSVIIAAWAKRGQPRVRSGCWPSSSCRTRSQRPR